MGDVKKYVKRAQKLMDVKYYVGAKICCDMILQRDRRNCKALVFLGEILGESDEALKYFQKAIRFHPRELFAWQGLAKYYERKDNLISKFELLRVYGEILKLQIERDKAEEVICKVAEIGVSLKDLNSPGILIDYLSTKPAHCLYQVADQQLLKMVIDTVRSNSLRSLLIQQRIAIKIASDPDNHSMCILLAKLVLMYNSFTRAFHFIIRLPHFLPNFIFRMWFCKYICSFYAQMETFREVDIEKHYNYIVQGFSNSKYAKLLNSMILYNNKKYMDAYMTCRPLVDFEKAELAVCRFFIKCTFKVRHWPISILVIKNIMSNLKDCKYKLELNKSLFLALAQQKKWPEAITAARKIPLEMLLVEEQAELAACYIQNRENPDRLMSILKPTAYYVQLIALTLIVNECYHDAIDVLHREYAENPVHYLYMARSYWCLKHYEVSCIYFLKASELDEDNAEPNFYLGKYHQNKSQLEIAQAYYQKAYWLDPMNPKILKRLSDVYLARGLVEQNHKLLVRVNYLIITLPWLHHRLAIYFKGKNDWKSTIKHLQYAFKCDNTDIKALEFLADAYEADKCVDLAIECLYKIIGLVPTTEAKYLFKIANNLISAERYQEALNTFETLLHLSPRSLFALKGTTDVNMILAEIKAKSGHFQLARHTAQKSIMYLITSIGICNKTYINWNILANAILFIAKLPDKHGYLEMKFGKKQELGNLGIINTKINMYKLGYYCFWRAQSLLPSNIERRICRLIASEIFDDELRAAH